MRHAVCSSHEGEYYTQYLHGWVDYGRCSLFVLLKEMSLDQLDTLKTTSTCPLKILIYPSERIKANKPTVLVIPRLISENISDIHIQPPSWNT